MGGCRGVHEHLGCQEALHGVLGCAGPGGSQPGGAVGSAWVFRVQKGAAGVFRVQGRNEWVLEGAAWVFGVLGQSMGIQGAEGWCMGAAGCA